MTNVNTEIQVLSVKGTAMNKNRARCWIDNSAALESHGFHRGARIDVEFGPTAITVRLNPEGKRKTHGKGTRALLDICEPVAQRDARFNGAERLRVELRYGLITITAEV